MSFCQVTAGRTDDTEGEKPVVEGVDDMESKLAGTCQPDAEIHLVFRISIHRRQNVYQDQAALGPTVCPC